MVYNFEDRLDFLKKRMREVNYRSITYSRDTDGSGSGASNSFTCKATCYEVSQNEMMMQGLSLDVRRRDYIISLSDYEFEEPPLSGDTIIDGSLVCRVSPRGDAPPYTHTNHRRNSYRIRTEVV